MYAGKMPRPQMNQGYEVTMNWQMRGGDSGRRGGAKEYVGPVEGLDTDGEEHRCGVSRETGPTVAAAFHTTVGSTIALQYDMGSTTHVLFTCAEVAVEAWQEPEEDEGEEY